MTARLRKTSRRYFRILRSVDERFSTYKDASEISTINKGLLAPESASAEMREVFRLAQETKELTDGYFDIVTPNGVYDPSGLVKGWAIRNAADILQKRGRNNFYIDVGGDVEVRGTDRGGEAWKIGVQNPFKNGEIVKALRVRDAGIATSGTYLRGKHIYDPKTQRAAGIDIVSMTVVGPDVYEADRFATAAFAMGRDGILFIDGLDGYEGYMIDSSGIATMTRGFSQYAYA